MTIGSRSLALAGGAALLVGVLGAGIAFGAGASGRSTTPGSPAASGPAAGAADPSAATLDAVLAAFDQAGTPGPPALASPGSTGQAAARLGEAIRRFARWRQLVHAALTVDRPGAGIATFDLDHGTITAFAAGSMTIAEAGGSSVTLATDTATRVRRDRAKATLADLRTGDEVVVASKVDSGGTARAVLVVVPPAASTSSTPKG